MVHPACSHVLTMTNQLSYQFSTTAKIVALCPTVCFVTKVSNNNFGWLSSNFPNFVSYTYEV